MITFHFKNAMITYCCHSVSISDNPSLRARLLREAIHKNQVLTGLLRAKDALAMTAKILGIIKNKAINKLIFKNQDGLSEHLRHSFVHIKSSHSKT